MSEETASKSSGSIPKKIYLVSYPKVVYLYPTFFTALIAGLYMTVTGNVDGNDAVAVAWIFLTVFSLNLVVFAFDFPRGTSLTLVFFVVTLVLATILLFRYNPDIVPMVTSFLKDIEPRANNAFYFFVTIVLGLIYVGVMVSVQFDYWEVRPNELLHHHGVLSDLKRYSAPNLRIDKEISDLFEYVLLRGGRLILYPSQERQAIVLENVFFINHKEEELTKMLGALQVQVRDSTDS